MAYIRAIADDVVRTGKGHIIRVKKGAVYCVPDEPKAVLKEFTSRNHEKISEDEYNAARKGPAEAPKARTSRPTASTKTKETE